MDRGLQSAKTMMNFDENSIKFIVRLKENRKFEEIESFLSSESPQKQEQLKL